MYCPKCGADVGGASYCPECGAKITAEPSPGFGRDEDRPPKRKKPLLKRWWFWALVLVIVIVAIASSTGNSVPSASGAPSASGTQATPEPPELELLDSTSTAEQYFSYVTGHIRNNTSKTYSYVQVSINLYDDNGTQVGSTLDNVTNLAPGDTWEFKALITDDNATKFSVVDITGY